MPQSEAAAPLSLRQFTALLSRHINLNPELQGRWVVAELSDFRMHGPHAYGQLIEKDVSGRTVAKMQATIWGNVLQNIMAKFRQTTGQNITTGMKVMLRLTATHSELYGLAANVSDIDPSYTLGDMERLRREILDTLRREGVYDANKSVPLPDAPQRIAVISAAGAAGYGDFTDQLASAGYAFYPLLFQANMQGDRTVPTILHALDLIEETEDFWDCVVIIRGGGATSDLNSFDNLQLARRVATFPLPIIVGIGHERDNTVLDYIANTRCKTPTAVAAFLNDRLATAEARAEELMKIVAERTRSMLNVEERRLSQAAAMIPVLAPARIQREHHRLDVLQAGLQQTATRMINRENMRLSDITTRLAGNSSAILSAQKARLSSIPDYIKGAARQRTAIETNRLDAMERLIKVLSPEATLRRGYSITRVDGHALRSAANIPPGTVIETVLPDGTFTSTIMP